MKRVLFLLLSPAIAYSQTAKDILLKMEDTMRQRKCMNYSINYTFKGTDRRDTVRMFGEVRMQKAIGDTVLGGMVRVAIYGDDEAINLHYPPGTIMLYDLKRAYKIFSRTKSIVFKDPHKTKSALLFDLYPEMLIWKPFLKTKQIREYTYPVNKLQMTKDTFVNNALCYKLQINFPGKKPMGDWHTILCIRKDDYTPIYREVWYKNGDQWQFESFHIVGSNYADTDPSVFSASLLPQGYQMNEIKPD